MRVVSCETYDFLKLEAVDDPILVVVKLPKDVHESLPIDSEAFLLDVFAKLNIIYSAVPVEVHFLEELLDFNIAPFALFHQLLYYFSFMRLQTF